MLHDGEKSDVLLATVGDVAMIVTLGGSKLIQVGKTAIEAGNVAGHAKKGLGVSMVITGLHLQGGAIIFNGTLAVRDAANGDTKMATIRGGQLVLQLVVLRSGVKALISEFIIPDRVITLAPRDPYVNWNPRADAGEVKLGEMLHGDAQGGGLKGVKSVEGAAESGVKGQKSGDYRFTLDDGRVVSADRYAPESGRIANIGNNAIKKSG